VATETVNWIAWWAYQAYDNYSATGVSGIGQDSNFDNDITFVKSA